MSDQVIILILGILTILATAFGTRVKASGEAKIAELQLELEKIKGQNAKTLSDEAQEDKQIDLPNNLLALLSDTFKRFDSLNGKIEALQEGSDEWWLSVKTTLENGFGRMTERIVEQREMLERSRHNEFLAFANEFAAAYAAWQKARTLDKNLFIYPSPNHPGWKYRYAMPVYSKITFYNAPWVDDSTPITGVEIDSEGELVHVIEDYIHGWHVVAKTKNGMDFPGIGYVPVFAVKLTEVKGEH